MTHNEHHLSYRMVCTEANNPSICVHMYTAPLTLRKSRAQLIKLLFILENSYQLKEIRRRFR